MRFIDEAIIKVSAGHGGPGSVSFRRETFAPRGGPDGGDGGRGGDIYFRASSQLSTLQDLRFKREYKAGVGMNGQGTNKAGRDGEDIEIKLPVGTLIRDSDTQELLVEFTEEGQIWKACSGGRGGKGNAHFVTSTFQAPRFAQPGEVGEFKTLQIELKLLADAAIIGFPNAGKSTFISMVSAARPKIADYAFTTLTPNLGVVTAFEHKSFVLADIPGLIEGAHRGLGLGHRFLKHIERTQVFLHLLDGNQILEDVTQSREDRFDFAIENVCKRYETIRNELGLFNNDLLEKVEIVAINKVELLDSEPDLAKKIQSRLKTKISELRQIPLGDGEPYLISCATNRGVKDVLNALYEQIEKGRLALSGPTEDTEGNSLTTLLPNHEKIRKKS